MIEHCTQGHRVYWLVQQLVTASAGFTQRFGIGVAADKEGRNWGGKCAAQPFDDFDPGGSIRQTIIGDNQIGWMIMLREADERRIIRPASYDAASPASKESLHPV